MCNREQATGATQRAQHIKNVLLAIRTDLTPAQRGLAGVPPADRPDREPIVWAIPADYPDRLRGLTRSRGRSPLRQWMLDEPAGRVRAVQP